MPLKSRIYMARLLHPLMDITAVLVMLQVCAVIARGDHPQILGTLRQKDASLRSWVQMEGGAKRGTLIRSADIFCVLL